MKVAITGKGGVGKTTLAALLAQAWAREGAKVLAIDVDPVASLAGALGFADPQNITPLSQMNELVEERTGAKPGTMGQMFKLNPTVDDEFALVSEELPFVRAAVSTIRDARPDAPLLP